MATVRIRNRLRVCNDFVDLRRYLTFTDKEKKQAEKIYKKVINCEKDEISFKFLKNVNTQHIIECLECIHFPYDLKYSTMYYNNEKLRTYKRITYEVKKFKSLDRRNKAVLNKIKDIVENILHIENGMDEMYAVRLIHDYICQNEVYPDKRWDKAVDAYDVLFTHNAICTGYALVFQMLCDYCGIRCERVSNDNHMWNMVKIDGMWYHIDVCWDDCTGSTKYYMKTREEMYNKDKVNHPMYDEIENDYWFRPDE